MAHGCARQKEKTLEKLDWVVQQGEDAIVIVAKDYAMVPYNPHRWIMESLIRSHLWRVENASWVLCYIVLTSEQCDWACPRANRLHKHWKWELNTFAFSHLLHHFLFCPTHHFHALYFHAFCFVLWYFYLFPFEELNGEEYEVVPIFALNLYFTGVEFCHCTTTLLLFWILYGTRLV